MIRTTVGLAAILFAAVGCTVAERSSFQDNPGSESASSVEADVEAIKVQSARFSQAYVDGDLDAQMAIYADDGVIAPPGRDFITGMEGLRRYWAIPEGVAVTSHRTVPVDIIVEGDLAYDWGSYEGASGPIGSPSEFSGKYLIVWERGDDQVWRMVQDMWNASS